MWSFLRRKPKDLGPTVAMRLLSVILDAHVAISELRIDLRRVRSYDLKHINAQIKQLQIGLEKLQETVKTQHLRNENRDIELSKRLDRMEGIR